MDRLRETRRRWPTTLRRLGYIAFVEVAIVASWALTNLHG